MTVPTPPPPPPLTMDASRVRDLSAAPSSRPTLRRSTALLEVVMCSGYPTQIIVWVMLAAFGLAVATETGSLSLVWVVTLSMVDSVLLVGLVIYFLVRSGDRPRHVFLGTRPIRSELRLGAYLIPVTFVFAFAVISALHWVVPGIRNVPENPFEAFLRSPSNAAVFAVVAVVAGGVREELQRAFILSRFERSLGGAWLGLGIFSIVFGLGHYPQGWDAVVVTGMLGAFWGLIYLVRRSVVSTILCHAGFNLTEILVAVAGANASSG